MWKENKLPCDLIHNIMVNSLSSIMSSHIFQTEHCRIFQSLTANRPKQKKYFEKSLFTLTKGLEKRSPNITKRNLFDSTFSTLVKHPGKYTHLNSFIKDKWVANFPLFLP